MPIPVTVAVNGSFSSPVDWAVLALEIRPGDNRVNRPPIAQDQSAICPLDTPVGVRLVATDPDLDHLKYQVLTQTKNGTLTGTAPDLTYTPAPGFSGGDSFTFRANDGTADSNDASFAISVIAVPRPRPGLWISSGELVQDCNLLVCRNGVAGRGLRVLRVEAASWGRATLVNLEGLREGTRDQNDEGPHNLCKMRRGSRAAIC